MAALPLAIPAQAASEVVVIEPLSVRGDLVSGDDVLVRLAAPDGASVEDLGLSVDGGQLVVDAFGTEPDGTALVLVSGLDLGPNRLRAELPDGLGAFIDLFNAPQGGPVFSGALPRPIVPGGSTKNIRI